MREISLKTWRPRFFLFDMVKSWHQGILGHVYLKISLPGDSMTVTFLSQHLGGHVFTHSNLRVRVMWTHSPHNSQKGHPQNCQVHQSFRFDITQIWTGHHLFFFKAGVGNLGRQKTSKTSFPRPKKTSRHTRWRFSQPRCRDTDADLAKSQILRRTAP